MYVCICNGVTDTAIRKAAADGVSTLSELTMRTGCAGSCGACAGFAEQVLHESIPSNARLFSLPVLAAA
jgi:bacterioferritin-associated ferredoxin